MLAEMSLDGRVFAFTFLLAVLTGLVFGLVPAWHASRSNLTETLKEASRGAVGGLRRHRWLSTFVVAQVALCVILLVGAGLMLRNLHRLTYADPGFDPANVLSLEMELPNSRYTNEPMRLSFYRGVIERIQNLPGVETVGAVNLLPMGNNNSNWAFGIEGGPPLEKGKYNLAEYRVVSSDYFQALRIPLKQGRAFSPQDDGKGVRIMIINETLARRYFPGENPIGRRISFSDMTNALEIVGVVGDQKHFGLGAEAPPIIYQPCTQNCWNLMSLVVRAKVEPMSLAAAVRAQIWAVDKDQPITKLRPMDDVVRDSISVQRFSAVLLLGSAGAGLLLAAIGIYGVLAYVVSQRTHEIGVRLALGAQVRDILRMVVGQGLMLTGMGLGIGLIVSLALGRLMQAVLYELSGNDPWTFSAVSILLGVVAAVACCLPARRATRVDPIVALRYE